MSDMRSTHVLTWRTIKRKTPPKEARREGEDAGQGLLYLASARDGREYATAPVERIAWPQGCDQCQQVIAPGAARGARSFRVSRGPSPTTLYICGSCVGDLCRASGIAEPEPGA